MDREVVLHGMQLASPVLQVVSVGKEIAFELVALDAGVNQIDIVIVLICSQVSTAYFTTSFLLSPEVSIASLDRLTHHTLRGIMSIVTRQASERNYTMSGTAAAAGAASGKNTRRSGACLGDERCSTLDRCSIAPARWSLCVSRD